MFYVLPWDLILRKQSLSLFNMYLYHDICLWWSLQNSLVLNIHIQGSFKTCSLLFGQAEMVLLIIWFLDHFTLRSTPSVNGVWIITFVSHLHVWVTKFKPSLMFFQLSVLTSNNLVWVNLSAILFDEAQHVVKTSTTGYVPVCYDVINLFIEPQNFLLIFLIYILKGWYLIVFFFDGLLIFFFHFVCKLLPNMGKHHVTTMLPKFFCLRLLTSKNQFVHAIFTDIVLIRLTVFGQF